MKNIKSISDIYSAIRDDSNQYEQKILDRIFQGIQVNRRNLSLIAQILFEYQEALKEMEVDLIERRKITTNLVYPLDFSEIFSFMYKDHSNAYYGKLIEYVIKNNNENFKRYITLLPGTVIEIINYMWNISDKVRESRIKPYDEIMKRKNLKALLELYDEYGDNLKQEKIDFDFDPLEEIVIATANIGLGKNEFTPLKNFHEFISGSYLTYLRDIDPEKGKKVNIEGYKNLYNQILSKFNKQRRPKETRLSDGTEFPYTNNTIDAQNYIHVRALNDTSTNNEYYYNLITRELTTKILSDQWKEDPLVKINVIKEGLPLIRRTQYIYYSVKIDNMFDLDDVKGRVDCIRNYRNTFDNCFNNLVKVINKNLEEQIVDEKKDGATRARSDRKARNIVFREVSKTLEDDFSDSLDTVSSMDNYFNFIKVMKDEKKYNQVMENARNELNSWSRETSLLLKNHLKHVDDPLLEEITKVINSFDRDKY